MKLKTNLKKLIIGCCSAIAFVNASQAQSLPNVVVIMADDLGPGDVSAFHKRYSNKPVQAPTPNIDQLVAEGMSFTDAHSPTALCAPSRYSVMTGNSTYRGYTPWGVWSSFAKTAVTPEDATIGRVAQQAGYQTAFVGKWHLGGTFHTKQGKVYQGPKTGPKTKNIDFTKWVAGNPAELGFDYDYTVPTGVQGPLYFAYENSQWAPLSKDSKIIFVDKDTALDPKFVSDKGPGMGDSAWDARKLNMQLADKAVDFIKRSAGDKPFLLNYWSPAVHIPHTPPKQIDGKAIAGTTPTHHLDMNRVLDIEVKRIIDALKATGEYQDTLIIFTSDNGGLSDRKANKFGHNSPAQFRGNKNTAFEGGHRVPFIAVWPGKIKANTTNDTLVNGTDIVATLANLMGVKLNAQQAKDSWNILPTLLGQPYQARQLLMAQAGSKNELILREGPWKLIIKSNYKVTKREPFALFNLQDDLSEKTNLINNPEFKARADDMFKRYWQIRESGQRTAPAM
ncbi:sulfatase [Saccharobesus litoralis]|uniref:Sulfatase n=1 Tax=Saccharobesus litoralis TaxID=2172099 RepID=A0A2S0VVJ8_9ALTE|nr:arylsulfatase [Saccharobesus litoralis]AWB68239.1 sulfatase [Saccharobesus litoralis]